MLLRELRLRLKKKFVITNNKRRHNSYLKNKEVFSALIFMRPPTEKSLGRGLVEKKSSVIYPTVLHSIIGYKSVNLGLCDSSDVNYYNH